MAYEMVCPERIDLIHKNYRKLCNLLVDVDEWGQVIILSVLTRYARTQFIDPNQEVSDMDFMYMYFTLHVYVDRGTRNLLMVLPCGISGDSYHCEIHVHHVRIWSCISSIN